MDERRTVSGLADSPVMSEYFATMRQFLETQERVMSTFFGDAAPPRPMLRARPLPALRQIADLPAAPASVVQVAAPVAAPVPATPVAKAVEPAAVVTVPAAPAPASAPAVTAVPKSGTDELSREKLLDMLLGIVEEKTGYPRDMVGLDQNLEADLGIDSIKRVEVVGAMLQRLPAAHREALSDSRSKLNTQPTLNGMLELIAKAKVGGTTVPFELAGVGKQAGVTSFPPRLVMRPRPEPLTPGMARRLTPGRFVLTRDRDGVAAALAAALAARGVDVVIVEPDVLSSEPALLAFCESLGADAVAGLVHLAALGAPALDGRESPSQWREALQSNEKCFFVLLRELSDRLADSAHVVAASGLGGLFGREGSASAGLLLQAGAVGALKSLREERPELRVKAVDLDPRRSAGERAADLLGEIELDGGRQEVGYPGGARTVFVTVAEDLAVDPARDAALKDLVVLATGGARGITAEVLRELARPGTTLVLTGRSELLRSEAAETAALADADALRAHFVAQVRAGALKLTPGEIQRRVRAVLDQREMRANVADFEAAGAAVEYHVVDVTAEDALRTLLGDVTARLGRIDGVVHGAGVIEDKRLADKASDSWSRVVETKIIGALLLQKHVDPSTLKFFTVFSSVAGRYGNSGQSDYATANELMNRLCVALQARWGDRVAVSALCWGPWGATKFGAGMVTAGTEAKFAEKGVQLVSAALGRRLFRQELARATGTPVEVIGGEGPWEGREAMLGVIRATPQPPELGPLLGSVSATALPTGERVLPVRLDPGRHLYLDDHVFDGKIVLPAAAALELMAEAARSLWPGWHVVEAREHRLLNGVEVNRSGRELQVFVSPPPYGSAEGFDVSVALQTRIDPDRVLTHYRCIIRLEQALPQGVHAPRVAHVGKNLAVAKAYREWLSHGPRLQMIERIDGLSPGGASARVRASLPADWLASSGDGAPGWVFDPALLDAAAQMAWIWARAYRDETALPTRFGRVTRYSDRHCPLVIMEYQRREGDDAHLVRGDVVFFDEAGEPIMAIEELDSVTSAALNRLGGGARRSAQDAAA